jgi:hypothetical protein
MPDDTKNLVQETNKLSANVPQTNQMLQLCKPRRWMPPSGVKTIGPARTASTSTALSQWDTQQCSSTKHIRYSQMHECLSISTRAFNLSASCGPTASGSACRWLRQLLQLSQKLIHHFLPTHTKTHADEPSFWSTSSSVAQPPPSMTPKHELCTQPHSMPVGCQYLQTSDNILLLSPRTSHPRFLSSVCGLNFLTSLGQY